MERLSAIVKGTVQGVAYRAFVMRRAGALGVVGWVRNRADGGVEVVAEGERSALDALLEYLHEGPMAARVTGVDVSWQPAQRNFSDFTIRY